MGKCKWTYNLEDDYDVYRTTCGNKFYFNAGGITDNKFKYCPYCGREILEESVDYGLNLCTVIIDDPLYPKESEGEQG